MARLLIPVALVAALIAVLVVVSSGGDESHRVRATLDAAQDVIPGIEVRTAGQKVGKVDGVETTKDGRAEVTLTLDDAIWPLPTGTKIRPRFGSSISYSGRWIELELPRSNRGTVAENGEIEAVSAVEVDRLLGAFDADTRVDLGQTVRRGGATLDRSRKGLTGTIERTPATLGQVNALFRDLSANKDDLHQLLVSTDRVVSTMAGADGSVGQILDGAARTFRATNDRAADLERILQDTPSVLVQGRRTLAKAEVTLDKAQQLTKAINPGVISLRRTARPLNDVLDTLTDIGPTARTTLATARPGFAAHRDAARPPARSGPTLKSTTEEAGRQSECIRPYTPEWRGMASTWTSFLSYGDSQDKYARALATALPFPNALPMVPPALESLVNVVFPRPPGQNAGQPWFIPECGVGEGVLSAGQRPRNGRAPRAEEAMKARIAIAAALAVSAVGVGAVTFGGGGGGPLLDLELNNASGIRKGTLVKVGGARVGVVDSVARSD